MRTLRTFAQLLAVIVVAFLPAMLVMVVALNPPAEDIQQLFVFMGSTGLFTILIAYLLYRGRVLQRFLNLHLTLVTIIVLTVLLIFINVWVTAQLMFISEHDLVLTTALLIFAGVVAAVSALFVANTLRERIHELSRGVVSLSRGDWQVRLSSVGSDELSQLAATFNQMATTLYELDEQKRQLEQTRRDLIAWVSHDLRTPLTAMRAMNEAMLDGVVADPETVKRYRQNIQNEIQHLSRLIDDLFELAQLDTGRVPLNRQMTSLHDLVSDTLSSMSAQADAQQVKLSASLDPAGSVVNIAPDKIQRVLYNLLDNALQHTPPGGEVLLTAQPERGQVAISVHNTGSYITPDDLPHVFKSFYRGEQSRAQAENGRRGTGLGLAIVRGFIEAHGGSISVESQREEGTTFTFTLPA